MTGDTPLACSLGASDLEQRLASMAEIGRNSLISRNTEGSRHLLRFQADAETRVRLEDVIAEEAKCCSFLDLSLKEEGEDLILSIAAPAEAEALAAQLARAF